MDEIYYIEKKRKRHIQEDVKNFQMNQVKKFHWNILWCFSTEICVSSLIWCWS